MRCTLYVRVSASCRHHLVPCKNEMLYCCMYCCCVNASRNQCHELEHDDFPFRIAYMPRYVLTDCVSCTHPVLPYLHPPPPRPAENAHIAGATARATRAVVRDFTSRVVEGDRQTLHSLSPQGQVRAQEKCPVPHVYGARGTILYVCMPFPVMVFCFRHDLAVTGIHY